MVLWWLLKALSFPFWCYKFSVFVILLQVRWLMLIHTPLVFVYWIILFSVWMCMLSLQLLCWKKFQLNWWVFWTIFYGMTTETLVLQCDTKHWRNVFISLPLCITCISKKIRNIRRHMSNLNIMNACEFKPFKFCLCIFHA